MFREDTIYTQHKAGMSITEIADYHSLKPSTVKYIIDKETKYDFDDIVKFEKKLRAFLASKAYPIANITRITHSLNRYISANTITSVESLIHSIKSDKTYIRGIGAKSKEVLLEFIESHEEEE